MTEGTHAAHFDSAARQEHATRLGMWVFLGSELLLFAGLFALYTAGRAGHPAAFRAGIAHADKTIGSVNTAVLLASSTSVAGSVEWLRRGRAAASVVALLVTLGLGVLFLVLKLSEYASHLRAGITPGGFGHFFAADPVPGLPLFWTLYFVTTGLHAVHVGVGIALLAITAWSVSRRRVLPAHPYLLENAALYWHLIDLVWIFLWPLYYLA
jgi:cytochrome c oxidase subunit 3